MTMLIYGTAAVFFLILVVCLVKNRQAPDLDERSMEWSYAPNLGSGRWLDLSERIFDPSDHRWLEQELAFPKLAKALVKARKQLAIQWLRALQSSFDDVVRAQGTALSEAPEDNSPAAWQMLWLTLRFKLLISYALFVVRVFGPYHRLLPSFSWVPFPQGSERSFRRPAMAHSRSFR